MTRSQQWKAEAAHTEAVLREAAERLLEWADKLAGAFFESPIPPEEVRQVARTLAHQGGRLSMAREMAAKGGAARGRTIEDIASGKGGVS